MKGKLKTKQIITNKNTGLGFLFMCCVFGCNFFKEPEK